MGLPTVRSLDFGFVAESHPRDVDFHFVTREKSEGSNERGSADSDEELPVLQASDGEDDNERGERLVGYDPDNGDVWGSHYTHAHGTHTCRTLRKQQRGTCAH